jgi:hypothetical protein
MNEDAFKNFELEDLYDLLAKSIKEFDELANAENKKAYDSAKEKIQLLKKIIADKTAEQEARSSLI